MTRSLFLTIIFVLTVINGSAQIGRAYNNLIDKDYERAHELFMKVIDDEPSNAIANFGMAMLYSNDEYAGKDLMTAWDYILNADQGIESLSEDDKEILQEYFIETAARPRRYPVERKYKEHKDLLLDKFVKLIREGNNLELVNKVLSKYPDFPEYQNTVHIRNYLEFRKAEKTNTVKAYNTFIKDFPDAAQVPQAREKRNGLIYKEVKEKNTIEAYGKFMKDHPTAKQYQQAKMNKIHLEYKKAKDKNTVTALEQFIAEYPNSLDLLEAKKQLKQLIYEKAKEIKTLEAYNDFIRKYPSGARFIDIFNLKSNGLGEKYKANLKINRPVEWVRAFDKDMQFEYGGSSIITNEGDFVIGGNTAKDTGIQANAWMLRLDQNGEIRWNKVIGDTLHDQVDFIGCDKTGNIYAAGFTNAQTDSMSGNAWIFKLTSDGGRVWSRTLPFPKTNAMAVNSNDNIFIGGFVKDSVKHPKVIKISKEGKKLWNRAYITPGEVRSIKPAGDNSVVIATDRWIFNLDTLGYVNWELMLDTPETVIAIESMPGDDIIIAGYTEAKTGWIRAYNKDRLLWNTKVDYVDEFLINDITFSSITGNIYCGGSIDQSAVVIELNQRGALDHINKLSQKCKGGVFSLKCDKQDKLIIGLNGTLNESKGDLLLIKIQ